MRPHPAKMANIIDELALKSLCEAKGHMTYTPSLSLLFYRSKKKWDFQTVRIHKILTGCTLFMINSMRQWGFHLHTAPPDDFMFKMAEDERRRERPRGAAAVFGVVKVRLGEEFRRPPRTVEKSAFVIPSGSLQPGLRLAGWKKAWFSCWVLPSMKWISWCCCSLEECADVAPVVAPPPHPEEDFVLENHEILSECLKWGSWLALTSVEHSSSCSPPSLHKKSDCNQA